MADYMFNASMVADPVSFQRAANALVTVYAASDTSETAPLALKDLTGLPIANPMTSTSEAIIPAFVTQVDAVKLVGGGLRIPAFSPTGVRNAAEAAAIAAQEAAFNAATGAATELASQIAAGEFKGEPGKDGANVLPTDAAVAQSIVSGTGKAAVEGLVAAAVSPLEADIANKVDAAAARRAFADSGSLGIFPGRKAGFIGDSHTQAVGPTNSAYAFPRQSMHHAGTFYISPTLSVVDGVGGQTSAQGLLRVDALLAQGVELLVIEFGANDSNNLLPTTTFAANIIEMVRRAKAAGCPVVISGVPPKEASVPSLPGSRPYVDAYNTWLASWCPRNGVEFADVWQTLMDPATGNLRADLANPSNAHLNDKGHYLWALVVSAAIRRAFKSSPFPASTQRPINKCANGWFINDTAAAAPTGWTLASGTGMAAAHSIIADDTGLLPAGAKWWRAAVNNTAGFDDVLKTYVHTLTGTVVNQRLAVSAYLLIEDLDSSWESGVLTHDGKTKSQVSIRLNAANKNTQDYAPGRPLGGGRYFIGPITQSVLVDDANVPAVGWSFAIPKGKNLAFRIGGVEVIDIKANALMDLA